MRRGRIYISLYVGLWLILLIFTNFRINYTEPHNHDVKILGLHLNQDIGDPSIYIYLDEYNEYENPFHLMMFFNFEQNLASNNISVYFSLISYTEFEFPEQFRFYADEIDISLGNSAFEQTGYVRNNYVNHTDGNFVEHEMYHYYHEYNPRYFDVETFRFNIILSTYEETNNNLTKILTFGKTIEFPVYKVNYERIEITWYLLLLTTLISTIFLIRGIRSKKIDKIDEFYLIHRFPFHLIGFGILTNLTFQNRLTIDDYIDTNFYNSHSLLFFFILIYGTFCFLFLYLIPSQLEFYRHQFEIDQLFSLGSTTQINKQNQLGEDKIENKLEELKFDNARSNYIKFVFLWQILMLLICLWVYIYSITFNIGIVYCLMSYFGYKVYNLIGPKP